MKQVDFEASHAETQLVEFLPGRSFPTTTVPVAHLFRLVRNVKHRDLLESHMQWSETYQRPPIAPTASTLVCWEDGQATVVRPRPPAPSPPSPGPSRSRISPRDHGNAPVSPGSKPPDSPSSPEMSAAARSADPRDGQRAGGRKRLARSTTTRRRFRRFRRLIEGRARLGEVYPRCSRRRQADPVRCIKNGK